MPEAIQERSWPQPSVLLGSPEAALRGPIWALWTLPRWRCGLSAAQSSGAHTQPPGVDTEAIEG